jgi:hypothetical protein
MRTLLLAASVLLFFCGGAAAGVSPWSVTGQTALPPGGSIDNPLPSNIGAIGSVTSLPFTVPSGCELMVGGFGIESYNGQNGVTVIFMWTGSGTTAQWRLTHASASVAAFNGSNEFTGQRLTFPAGTIINVRLSNGATNKPNWLYGWYLSGELSC